MSNLNTDTVAAVLYDLDEDIARELGSVLASCGHQVDTMGRSSSNRERLYGADVIFCPADVDKVRRLKRKFPDSAVVVASRLPEVTGWLDALDAGAADYCAAPFEAIQIRWVLQSHVRPTHLAQSA